MTLLRDLKGKKERHLHLSHLLLKCKVELAQVHLGAQALRVQLDPAWQWQHLCAFLVSGVWGSSLCFE